MVRCRRLWVRPNHIRQHARRAVSTAPPRGLTTRRPDQPPFGDRPKSRSGRGKRGASGDSHQDQACQCRDGGGRREDRFDHCGHARIRRRYRQRVQVGGALGHWNRLSAIQSCMTTL